MDEACKYLQSKVGVENSECNLRAERAELAGEAVEFEVGFEYLLTIAG